MIENSLELQPVGYLCRATYIGQVGKNGFLIHRPHDDVGAKFLRAFFQQLPELFLREGQVSIVDFINTTFFYDPVPVDAVQVKEVDFPGMHLRLKAGIIELFGRFIYQLARHMFFNIFFDDGSKNPF